jgi:hypothetical protein
MKVKYQIENNPKIIKSKWHNKNKIIDNQDFKIKYRNNKTILK